MKMRKRHINLLHKSMYKSGKYWAYDSNNTVCHVFRVILLVMEDVAVIAAAEIV